jgi:hypothetical protein
MELSMINPTDSMDAIRAFCQQHMPGYPSKASLAASLCGVAALEMLACAFRDYSKIKQPGNEQLSIDISAHLGGATLCGVGAVNPVPYAAIAGATIFALYSAKTCNDDGAYRTSKWVGNLIRIIWEYSVYPVVNKIGVPVSKALVGCAGRIYDLLLPKHPIWLAVAFSGLLIAAYKAGPMALIAIRQQVQHYHEERVRAVLLTIFRETWFPPSHNIE